MCFVLISCFCSSCNNASTTIRKEGLLYCEVVGDLYHQQYWDENDSWDLTNMYLELHYEDGEVISIEATNENAEYTFEPSSPVGLDHNVTSITIVGGTFTDYKGEKHEIKGRKLSPIRIVDYPYGMETQLEVQNERISPLFYVAVGIDIMICGLIVIYFVKKKRKSQSGGN